MSDDRIEVVHRRHAIICDKLRGIDHHYSRGCKLAWDKLHVSLSLGGCVGWVLTMNASEPIINVVHIIIRWGELISQNVWLENY